jgi:hypothetical protein
MDDLVKRLREKQVVTGYKRTWPYSEDVHDMVLVPEYGPDPDAQEAADRIAELEAERDAVAARLERALVLGAENRDRADRLAAMLKELEGELRWARGYLDAARSDDDGPWTAQEWTEGANFIIERIAAALLARLEAREVQ